MNTEVGKIAAMLSNAPEQITPYAKAYQSAQAVLRLLCTRYLCAYIYYRGGYGNQIIDMLMMAVSLGVTPYPKGYNHYPSASYGVQRLVKQNAIVRNLPSVKP